MLRARILPLLHVLGLVIVVFGVSMLFPLAVAEWTQDAAREAYDVAVLITLGAGLLFWLVARPYRRELKARDGYLLVVLIWVLLPVFAALPLLYFMPNLSFTDAYFETMSGLTTTGSTILTGLDALPASINLWRGQLVLIGGLGVIVLVTAVLPLLGIGGRQMFKAEATGPMKDSKLTPRMAETAKGLWTAYLLLTGLCISAFMIAGMGWVDAFVHAFSVMGLGGFSSHDASFGYFNSLPMELIAEGFMLLAGINFATHFMALRGRTLISYRHDPELRWFLGIVLSSCLALALVLWLGGVYPDFWQALRFASFNTISIATTTGLTTTDYALWPIFTGLWMLFLCSFVTSSGSTGGGIKMMRAILLYKQVYRELKHLMHPAAQLPVRLGEMAVPNKIMFAVLAFAFIYMASVVILSFVLIASGLDVITAFTAIVANINNTGPGLGQVGPATTYAILTDFQTWVCTFAMLLGRLELFTLLVVLTPVFWRK
ncbi:MAG: TrkH family potassium uptake protein [Betaproteobacteria bacterium]|nr:MAG: TrkH family potassium uptake protein [Betaproteobacteria bacterium]